jgi:endonuclease/exonuclease/phosphatase family metal-dependent hydrolase
VLSVAERLSNVVLMGDFNFRPRLRQYEVTTGLLRDAWADAGRRESTPRVPPPRGSCVPAPARQCAAPTPTATPDHPAWEGHAGVVARRGGGE